MSKLRSITGCLLPFLVLLFVVACNNKDLCYHHDHRITLRLAFDWRDAPDANPRGMVVWFYPIEGTEGGALRFDLSPSGSEEIKVPAGKYNVISYNNDTELSRIGDSDDFLTHHAFTREGSIFEPASGSRAPRFDDLPPRPDSTENERVMVSPDQLWGCNALDVLVTEQGVSYLCFPLEEKDDWYGRPPVVTEHVITLYPHDLVCHYSYEIRNVKNLGTVTNMCGVLTGMAPTLHFHDESLGKECVSIPLPAYRADDSTIRGEFLTFGHNAGNTTPHRFGLYLWLLGDRTLFYGKDDEHFNVTEQIHSAADPRHVHFIIDGLDLPPVMGDSGWDPSFEDWDSFYEDIVIPSG